MKLVFILVAGCLGLAALCQASVILTLDPTSGLISGAAGNTVGWGFTLSSPADFAVITSSNFCLGASGVTNTCLAPTLGVFSDYIASNFTIAGPSPESPMVTQLFQSSTSTGLGSFAISVAAPTGATDMGQIVATYDLYSVDPLASNFDPIADLLSAGNYLTDPASITVGSPIIITQEPSYTVLTVVLFIAFFITRWSRTRRRSRVLARVFSGLLGIVVAVSAQQKPDFGGEYTGILVGMLHVKLHLIAGRNGTLSGTIDNPDQAMLGMQCTNIVINGQALSFNVPMVHGAWVGFLSNDGASLSGTWSQGTPLPLNFTRANSSPINNQAGGATASSAPAGSDSPCSLGSGAYYWDGSTWKQMTAPAILKTKQGVNWKVAVIPGMPSTKSNTTIMQFENAEARMAVGANPKFCVGAPTSVATANIVVGRLDIGKDYRQIESVSKIEAYGKEVWIPKNRLQPFDAKRVSDTVVEITSRGPLPPGQYLLVAGAFGSYDFGVLGK